MVKCAAEFLNFLEDTRDNGNDLPLRYVMKRIRKTLGQLLDEGLQSSPSEASEYATDLEEETRPSYSKHSRWFDEQKTSYNIRYRVKPAWNPVRDFKIGIENIVASGKPVYLDIQMLYTEEGPVIKEFSAACQDCETVCITSKVSGDLVWQVPGNEYAVEEIHGIPWDVGVIEENALRRITKNLFDGKRRVFVKGAEKRDSLVKRFGLRPNVIEDIYTKASLAVLVSVYGGQLCPYHRFTKLKCAMQHSEVLMAYSLEEATFCSRFF